MKERVAHAYQTKGLYSTARDGLRLQSGICQWLSRL